ncbi:DUF1919 domain-containing protein [Clostridium psychrophilum]|uniref:DUF1919 domain-containing protein n=1 Tax=Clostridium psychrophilum TaxID=132926 RepID=UPI001C0C5906|nr:DUF1919 domain-containing protein [Clostridium psychrophilum]MBU3180691.1 DUF1919 domain-containing protein [Clostridium psychrophilum]
MLTEVSEINRKIINSGNKNRLKNKDFSLISSNCNGAFMMHDLDLKFLTPTVNLFFFPNDFIKFVENIDFYLKQKLEFIDDKNYDYPIGKLKDVKIHFMHYKNNEDAEKQWYKRSKRINPKNIFIMMTDRDGCTEEMIRDFDNLPYKNKVIFTNKKYKQYSSAFYIKGFENQSSIGNIFEFKNILGKKYYDDFDYVNWFNNGIK